MAYFLPFRPLFLSDLRVLGSRKAATCLHITASPLVHFNATSAFSLSSYRKAFRLYSTSAAPLCLLLELSCPSAYPDEMTLLFTTLRLAFPVRCSDPEKFRSQGLATLSAILAIPSLGTLHPQRSWASLFKAFLHLGDRIGVSPHSLRSCAFPENLSGFLPALQRFTLTKTAVPFLAP